MVRKQHELDALRDDWEEGYSVVATASEGGDYGTQHVLLRKVQPAGFQPIYALHRYFYAGGSWRVSVDAKDAEAEQMMCTLLEG